MKLSLAPIQGMTIASYRNAYARLFEGIDEYYSPFIATSDINKVSNQLLKDLLPERNSSDIKLIPQLLSNNGEDFCAFASAIVNLGYKEINWNIGCPFPMVTNKRKGSGLLPYPNMIREFLDRVCSDNTYTLTVKMRLGLDTIEQGLSVIEVLNDYPLGGVIIHARTGLQMYTGKVDLDAFETLASACKHEITYNGDIYTYNDFLNISRRFPEIKNYMLGRGALCDPFLPGRIKGNQVPQAEKIGMVRKLHEELFDYYRSILSGDKHLCDKMKEFWSYVSIHMDITGKFMKKIKKCNNSAAYLDAVNMLFSNDCQWSEAPLR